MDTKIKGKNGYSDSLNIRQWNETQEERMIGKIIEDYGILEERDMIGFNYHIFLTEKDNKYHIAIKKTNDIPPERDPSYTLLSIKNVEKLRDYFGHAIIKCKSKPLKTK